MTLQAKWSSCDVTMKKYCMQGVCCRGLAAIQRERAVSGLQVSKLPVGYRKPPVLRYEGCRSVI